MRRLKRFINRVLDARITPAAAVGVICMTIWGLASQAPLLSPTSGTVSGLALTQNYNNALDALNTQNSGGTAPTNQLSGAPSLGNYWLDTTVTPARLKWYDGAQWNIVAAIDATNHLYVPVVGGGVVTSITSATTTDLCSANANIGVYVAVTGTTTITGFGSSCQTGQMKVGVFTGVLTLTHNASSLILPANGSNITTAAGDTFSAVYLGSGNWRVLVYQHVSGAATVTGPTVQNCTSGLTCDGSSHTYTATNANVVRVKVRMCAAGGGGAASAANGGNNGGQTSFGSWIAANGLGGGTTAVGVGGSGGANGSGTLVLRLSGADGNGGGSANSLAVAGVSVFGGASAGKINSVGNAAKTASCSGGAGANNGSTIAGSGGAGEYVEFWATFAQANSASYTVGSKATGGAAGGTAGADSGSGNMTIEEFYQLRPDHCEPAANDNFDADLCKAA